MAHGSIRQRGKDSWELRVYWGIDRATARQRWITKTVHGTQRFARGRLEDLMVEAGRARVRAGSLSDPRATVLEEQGSPAERPRRRRVGRRGG